jgi:hypothetical protein
MQSNHVIRIVTTAGDATEVFAGTQSSCQYPCPSVDGTGTQAQLAYVGATLLILTFTCNPQLDLYKSVSCPPRLTAMALTSVHLQPSGLAVGPVTGNLYFSE